MFKRLRHLFGTIRGRVHDAAIPAPDDGGPETASRSRANATPRSKFDYRTLSLSAAQIDAQAYKAHLGGGAAGWEKRGAFQLALMRHLGLREHSSLLDIGCGPLRAGVHFLEFLTPGGYRGVDFNPSLVAAAHRTMDNLGMGAQTGRVSVLQDFDFSGLGETYDFLLCFSVLNHCSAAEQARFFAEIPRVMNAQSRLVVTHAGWFDAAAYPALALVQAEEFGNADALPQALALEHWGFDDPQSTPLPIRVFRI